MHPRDALVPGMDEAFAGCALTRASLEHGHRTALVDGQRTVTFTQVEQRTNRLARALLALGLQPGQHVALLMDNGIEAVETPFACEKAGLPFVPLNVRHTVHEHIDTLLHADAVALVAGPAYEETALQVQQAIRGLTWLIGVDNGIGHPNGPHTRGLIEQTRDHGVLSVPVSGDHVIRLAYTSGTTGKPKGVVYTHKRWYQRLFSQFAGMEYALDPGDTMIHVGPLTHAAGVHLLPCYLRGALNVIHRGFDASRVLDDIEAFGATHIMLGPTMLRRLVDEQRRHHRETASLKRIHYGTSPTSPSLIREALQTFGPVLRQQYGLTEAVQPISVLYPYELEAAVKNGHDDVITSCGHVALTQAVQICDESGAPLPPGETGEIAIAMQGSSAVQFWKPRESEQDCLRDGWFFTGDLGRLRADNLLTIVGRKKDMVITGGFNVYALEVENALLAHPGVQDVAVIGTPDPEWGEIVTACVVCAGKKQPTHAELSQHTGQLIAGYKKPRRYIFLESLPRNVTGKIAKNILKDQIEALDQGVNGEHA